jgi:hypothetical protein
MLVLTCCGSHPDLASAADSSKLAGGGADGLEAAAALRGWPAAAPLAAAAATAPACVCAHVRGWLAGTAAESWLVLGLLSAPEGCTHSPSPGDTAANSWVEGYPHTSP